MLYIAAYLMIGVLWALVKTYIHPPSAFFAEVEADLKKNRQKVPNYATFCVMAFLLCVILWPANITAIIFAGRDKE